VELTDFKPLNVSRLRVGFRQLSRFLGYIAGDARCSDSTVAVRVRPEVRVDSGGQRSLFLFRDVAIDHTGKHLTRNRFAIFFQPMDGHGLDIGAELHHQHFVGDSPTAEISALRSCRRNRTAVNFWQLLLLRCSCAPLGTGPLLVGGVFLCALVRICAPICPVLLFSKDGEDF
jgi:hypothetical protein